MVDNYVGKRSPGRPRAFQPDEALDRAVELFWQHGYEGVDVEQIARAVHVTKPALYREFGDKPTLLLKAVQRYAQRYGGPMVQAFLDEPEMSRALTAFVQATVENATAGSRTGCMMAAAVSGRSDRVDEIRAYAAAGLAAAGALFARRFAQEIAAQRVSSRISAEVRGRAMIDLMQGLLLRAKAGVPRHELLRDGLAYVDLLLQ